MSSLQQELSSSPSRVGNFIIPYSRNISLNQDDTVGLLNFLHANSNPELSNTDISFFPRAFTDKELIDESAAPVRGLMERETNNRETLQGSGGSFIQGGFQSDVVMASSFQRPGPDGSPALVSNGSQGLRHISNTSETGELFAPVRALNFSEMDQSSQVEENYSENGRFVSTPDRQDNSNMSRTNEIGNTGSFRYQEHSGVNFSQYDSHHNDREELSPEFRQLEADGEADSQLSGTGTFQPSAMRLSQEFSDSHTGVHRSSLGFGESAFSPLSSSRQRTDVNYNESETPPLHSPGINSPYSIQNKPNTNHENISRPQALDFSEDPQELQFSMSPSKGQGDYVQSQFNNDSLEDFDDISPDLFQQRYLQRTQVSVMLPQATYDSLAEPTDTQVKERPTGLPTESLDGRSHQQASPERVIDIIQNQVSYLRQNELGDLAGERERTISQTSDSSANQGAEKKVSTVITSKSLNAGNGVSGNRNSTNLGQSNFNNNVAEAVAEMNHSKIAGKSGTGTGSGNETKSTAQELVNSNRNQGAVQKNMKSVIKPVTSQSLSQPSSSVIQETASQKSKTSSKFAPTNVKSTSVQGKEFKRPSDVTTSRGAAVGGNVRRSQSIGFLGMKKPSQAESDMKTTKSKPAASSSASEQSIKPKTIQNSVLQRSKHQGIQNGTKSRNGAYGFGSGNGTQPRNSTQGGKANGSSSRSNHSGESLGMEDEDGDGKDAPVVTQVEQTSPVLVETPPSRSSQVQNSQDIQGMEDVRHQLQGMLRLSADSMSVTERSHYEHSDILAGHGMNYGLMDPSLRMENRLAGLGLEYGQLDTSRRMEASWQMYHQPQDDVSEITETFPSFTSQFMQSDSGNVSRSDVSLHTENQRLKDILEKERYRRKHCEQYIQQLNVKLLETQQQVAVAVSTDKKKDIMIEQLDKQLAKVVEGWKKRDADKEEFIEQIRRDKEEIEKKMKQQEQMVGQFEQDMSEAVEALRAEKETSAQTVSSLKEELNEAGREKAHVEEVLEAEREKVQLVQQECDHLREAREQLDKKLDQMQRRLHREQDDWFQREQELLQRIEEVAENNSKILQVEKTKNEEQSKLADEMVEQLQCYTTKAKKLEIELDAAQREKESLKVEMGIMEAKFENAQRILEADLHSNMEKEVTEQVAEVQRKMEKMEDELREKHREQVIELNQRHGREIEIQLAQFRDELHKKEDEVRKQMQELESRLQEYRNENAALKLSKQKLESQRLEILTKLQYMMQSQWNEALSLLSATPKRKRNHSSEDRCTQESEQPIPTVNFNLHSPYRPSAPGVSHERSTGYSPGQDSVVSHSTAKSGHEGHSHRVDPALGDIEAVETSAALHVKELQDYINSVTQMPDWISSLESQTADTGSQSQDSQSELAAILSSHMQKLRLQNNASQAPLVNSQPVSDIGSSDSAILQVTSQNLMLPQTQSSSPPRPVATDKTTHLRRKEDCASNSSAASVGHSKHEPHNSQTLKPLYGGDSVSSWNTQPRTASSVSQISQAVPIRPPQQLTGLEPFHQMTENSVLPGPGYFQGGQSFSPPTKQSNPRLRSPTTQRVVGAPEESHTSLSTVLDESDRLNEDYSHLSERLQQHESHQNELQHYIQMLLHRPPGDETGQGDNHSLYSADQSGEELDLNDTAQAAQLQRELDRIQELREKREGGQKRGREQVQSYSEAGTKVTQSQNAPSQNKILNATQMAEISKLLQQVKGQSEMENPQISELIDVLKQWKDSSPSPAGKEKRAKPQAQKHSPRSDRQRELASVKRNLQFQPPKAGENAGETKATPGGKPVKKMERKIAGGAAKAEGKGNKFPVWK